MVNEVWFYRCSHAMVEPWWYHGSFTMVQTWLYGVPWYYSWLVLSCNSYTFILVNLDLDMVTGSTWKPEQMNPAKTELLWAGSKHNTSLLGSHAPVRHLHSDTVTASDHARVLGVTFSSDPSLEKHVSKTCSASFHWLRQLRRVRKRLDDGSAAMLVHAFVTSRVDYCNALYAGASKTVTDKLQRVLNAAARVASDTRKFHHGLTTLLHDEVHWLDVPESPISWAS